MNLLTIEHLTKSYTERLLFNDTDFSMQEGDKIGVIGINGTGKSTLLKIVAGLEEPDQGTVTRGRTLTIRYLSQNPVFEQGQTVLQAVLDNYRGEENLWEVENQAKIMLTKLGITDFADKVSTLSGGQKKRIALAGVLLNKADILLLDEPTNHLDSEMAKWLEDYLKQLKGALLMITHDRYFLDSVANRIVELDQGKLYSYGENYSGYLRRKAEREAIEVASERKRQSLLRVELEWMMRGARARSTKQKARIERFEALKNREASKSEETINMNSVSARLGRSTIELAHLDKSYGNKELIKDFSYIFLKNDRIGIIGKNGCGKSTLMKIIMHLEEPDSGTIEIGQTVKIGYFSQEGEEWGEDKKVIEYIRDTAEYVRTSEGQFSATQMLERFLFPSSMQYSRISKLSGGEKRRLYLLKILMGAPNVLILDEPTNDLDIQTLTVLEDYLDRFSGIVIAVSHDRYFLDRVTRRIFAFEEDGKVVQYEGGYTDYQAAYESRQTTKAEKAVPVRKGTDSRVRERKLKFTYQEQKDFDEIEGIIHELEDRLQVLDIQIGKEASNYLKLNELTAKKEEVEKLLEEKIKRWMYLEELAEHIEKGR